MVRFVGAGIDRHKKEDVLIVKRLSLKEGKKGGSALQRRGSSRLSERGLGKNLSPLRGGKKMADRP